LTPGFLALSFRRPRKTKQAKVYAKGLSGN